ncbi:MAG TPA: TetR/AcrR family transcriptional regulator [Paracoccaceae bacterium]
MGADEAGTRRDDWANAAFDILLTQGVEQVKVLTLAQRLGCSRSSFYWFFDDRQALLDCLLEIWAAKNTLAITQRAARPAVSITQAVLHVFECWTDARIFDARLDFAVREWARRTPAVRDAVQGADAARVRALTAMFARHGFAGTEALIRARTLYYTQIGYYALDVGDSDAQRAQYLAAYVKVFTGMEPAPAEAADFLRRTMVGQVSGG